MAAVVWRNLVLSVAFVGLAVFFEMKGNRPAAGMVVAAFLALWMNNGRGDGSLMPAGGS